MPDEHRRRGHRIGHADRGERDQHEADRRAEHAGEEAGRWRSCGATIATKPAGKAASRPNVFGSIAEPASAPTSVPTFQHTYTATPGDPERGPLGARVVLGGRHRRRLVDRRVGGDQPRRAASRGGSRDIASPYTPLRAASSIAPPRAAPVVPPAATTLTALNCEAPVNTSSDITQAWATEPPAATAPTPNVEPEHADRRTQRRRPATTIVTAVGGTAASQPCLPSPTPRRELARPILMLIEHPRSGPAATRASAR